ncbi:hypothetical protein SM764_18630 [Pseudophaeobacter sp. 1A16562]|uniref:hypothetical protein n=1 Tax=Pseudophaeobacter sp. 1A16562 TaxID=3098143 RepID=UPI0034D65BFC
MTPQEVIGLTRQIADEIEALIQEKERVTQRARFVGHLGAIANALSVKEDELFLDTTQDKLPIPLYAAAEKLKAVADKSDDERETYEDEGEYIGSVIGAGVGAGLGFGVPGAAIGAGIGNVIGGGIGRGIRRGGGGGGGSSGGPFDDDWWVLQN